MVEKFEPGDEVVNAQDEWVGVVVAVKEEGFMGNAIITVAHEYGQDKYLDIAFHKTGRKLPVPEAWPLHPIGGYPIPPENS